jgi:flagellar basal body rod protein FlgG
MPTFGAWTEDICIGESLPVLLTEDGYPILTENGYPITVDGGSPINGTMWMSQSAYTTSWTDDSCSGEYTVNYLLNEDGTPILDENGNPIVVES